MHLYKTISFLLDDIIFEEPGYTQLDVIFHNDGFFTTNNKTNHVVIQSNQDFLQTMAAYEEHPESTVLRGDIIRTLLPVLPDGTIDTSVSLDQDV